MCSFQLISNQEYSDWIKQRIEQYGFIEGQDYIVFHKNVKNQQGGRPSIEYGLTLDMAKELCMIENNENGRIAQRYLIDMKLFMSMLLKWQSLLVNNQVIG